MQDYRRLAIRSGPVRTHANYAIGEISSRKVRAIGILCKAEIGTVADDFPLALVAVDVLVRDATADNSVARAVVFAYRDRYIVNPRLLSLALPP